MPALFVALLASVNSLRWILIINTIFGFTISAPFRRCQWFRHQGVTLTQRLTIKILRGAVNHLSVSEHVRDVIGKCGKTRPIWMPWKFSRHTGKWNSAFTDRLYCTCIGLLTKLFVQVVPHPLSLVAITASDKRHIEAFVHRVVRFLRLYSAAVDNHTPPQLAEDTDDKLFRGE